MFPLVFHLLAHAWFGVWSLAPTTAPTANNWVVWSDGSTLVIREDAARTLVTCTTKRDCSTYAWCVDVVDRCEVK